MSAESLEPKGAGGPLEFLGYFLGRPLQNWGVKQAQRVENAGRFVASLGKKGEQRGN